MPLIDINHDDNLVGLSPCKNKSDCVEAAAATTRYQFLISDDTKRAKERLQR